MTRRDIELSIEKLVLEGFTVEEGERIRASVERELTRLLTDQGVSERLGKDVNIVRLNGGQIGIKSGADAAPAGRQISQAIWGAIKR